MEESMMIRHLLYEKNEEAIYAMPYKTKWRAYWVRSEQGYSRSFGRLGATENVQRRAFRTDENKILCGTPDELKTLVLDCLTSNNFIPPIWRD